jgi:hypothetical protein
MKKRLLAALMLNALLATAAAAGAADEMSSGHDAMAQSAKTATMLCRPAAMGEKSNAATADKAPLVCKNIDMTKVEKGPAMPTGATASDVNSAWVKMLVDYSFINAYGS